MAFLLILPLAIFALVLVLVVSIFASIEIAERRRPQNLPRRRSRAIFRPLIIEGGKGKPAPVDPPADAAPAGAAPAEPAPIRLVRSAPS